MVPNDNARRCDEIDPATIIFAFLALFVLWKLRSVLGERTGLEQKPNEGRGPFPAPVSPPPSGANDDARCGDLPNAEARSGTVLTPFRVRSPDLRRALS